MFVSGILRRSAAAAIAVRAYEEGLTKKEKKSPNFVEYVLNFWDFDNSFYVNLNLNSALITMQQKFIQD